MSEVARSGLVMAAGTMTSRILGLVRATMLAAVIGATGLTADAFQIANTLPNQFYALLAGGVLNAVLVPQIIKSQAHADGGQGFTDSLITLALLVIGGSTLVLTAAAPVLAALFSDTSNTQALTLTTAFAFICLPQVFFYGAYSLFGQILVARAKFGAYMWAPVAANLVAIGGLVLFEQMGLPRRAEVGDWTPTMIGVLAGSATLSIAIQAACLIVPLRAIGFRFHPRFAFRGVGLGSASRVAKWTFAGVLVSTLGFVVTSKVLNRAGDLAAQQGIVAASRSTYDYAFLLFMVPHALVTVSLVTALYTRMARAVHEEDRRAFVEDFGRGLRMPAVVLIPVTTLIIALGPLVTSTLFFRSPIPETNAIAGVMMTLVVGVIPYGWIYLNERAFYANEDAFTAFRIQCVVTAISVLGTLVAAGLAPPQTGRMVGLAQSTAYAVGGLIGFAVLRRRYGSLGLGQTVRTYLGLGVPAIVTALAIGYAVPRLLPDVTSGRGASALLGGAVVLAVAGVLQLLLTWAGARLLGVREVTDLLEPVLRRLPRR